MDILIHCVWHVKIYHYSDIHKVESSAEYSSTDHHFKVSIQKTLQTYKKNHPFTYKNHNFLDKCDIITMLWHIFCTHVDVSLTSLGLVTCLRGATVNPLQLIKVQIATVLTLRIRLRSHWLLSEWIATVLRSVTLATASHSRSAPSLQSTKTTTGGWYSLLS